jgi:predicted AAA+ superfamily ATPase
MLENSRMNRNVRTLIEQDMEHKMVFLTGPRQVGKTWLARSIAASIPDTMYLNYDRIVDRRMLVEASWPVRTPFLVFDEIHKMPEWKNWLKGIYDTRPEGQKILVTGSSRLETFRQSGDSMAGRYFQHRLPPLVSAELRAGSADFDARSCLDRLLERGGFPEPYLAASDTHALRWRLQYAESLIQNDILDFERIHDLRTMKTLFALLRSRVGSPLSFASLAGDLQVSPTTVLKYVEILEALYIVFRIHPWSENIGRSLLKEPKLYFFDTGLVDSGAPARLENQVAVSLLAQVWADTDRTGVSWELRYLRTKDGREVDFCMVRDQEVERLIEVKQGHDDIDPNLWYFCEKYGHAGVQLVRDLRLPRDKGLVQVRDAAIWLADLGS